MMKHMIEAAAKPKMEAPPAHKFMVTQYPDKSHEVHHLGHGTSKMFAAGKHVAMAQHIMSHGAADSQNEIEAPEQE
jgi:hypothetical protein